MMPLPEYKSSQEEPTHRSSSKSTASETSSTSSPQRRRSNQIITTEEDEDDPCDNNSILGYLNAATLAAETAIQTSTNITKLILSDSIATNGTPSSVKSGDVVDDKVSKVKFETFASINEGSHLDQCLNKSTHIDETSNIVTQNSFYPIRKNTSFSNSTNLIEKSCRRDSSFDIDETQHKKRGKGFLASDADLSLTPEKFAMGCTLLQLCAIGNLSQVQSYVVHTFSDVNFRDYDRRTALHVSASEGHLDIVRYLISKGAKVNRTDRWGGSPLDDAHRHRHKDVARCLRARGGRTGSVDLNINLIAASASGDIEEVRMILSSLEGTNLDLSESHRSGSVLRGKVLAATLRRKSSELDLSGPSALATDIAAIINKGDYDKRTALHLAASEGHLDVVEYLCKMGANVNAMDRWGSRPLDDALEKRNERVANILKGYGATSSVISSHTSSLHSSMHTHSSLLQSAKLDEDENLRVDFSELEMIERIGSGAFGEIYKCRWRGILVAAKCIKASKIQKEWLLKNRIGMDQSSDRLKWRLEVLKQTSITEEEKQLALEDFRRETSIMRRLRHPNIIMMLGYSHSEELEVMISELMKCSLLDIFNANNINGTQKTKRTQIIYAQQLAQGLNHMHKCRPPIIHRDVKPANLLLDFSGSLKIADFGLAKIRNTPETNEQEAFMMTGETGSYRFMAPEVFRHEEYTETVDVYSYAMIFYYMIRGTPPWSGFSGIDAVKKAAIDGDRPIIPRDVDERLATLLKRCWDENPRARPSFDEIITFLAMYSRDVFNTNENEVPQAKLDKSCGCSIS